MGLLDMASIRSKMSSNLSELNHTKSNKRFSRERDQLSSLGHSSSASLPSRTTNRDAARRSKLERMMGADVPLQEIQSSQNKRKTPGSYSEIDLYQHKSNSTPNQISSHSISSSSDIHYPTRPFKHDLPGPNCTTFTKLAEADCPVCLEPLSYRLAGEKPHVVPTCGHALHNACFTAVYGSPEMVLAQQNSSMGPTSSLRMRGAGSTLRASHISPPGMCGVCRKPIVLGGDEQFGGKSHKLTGMVTSGWQADRATISSGSISERGGPEAHEDDPLEIQSTNSKIRGSTVPAVSSLLSFTSPTIKARPEYSTIYRNGTCKEDGKVNVVCVLSVEVQSRRSPLELHQHTLLDTIHDDDFADQDIVSGQPEYEDREAQDSTSDDLKRAGTGWEGNANVGNPARMRSPLASTEGEFTEQGDKLNGMERSTSPDDAGFSFGATPAALPDNDPSKLVVQDLRARISDWKGHSLDHFGPFILHDLLNIRQDSIIREFHVYLFQQALLCVSEEKKKGLGRFIPSTAPSSGADPSSVSAKPALKLKGRIYLRHIRRVLDSSVAGELSISITMDDDSLDQFVLCFRNKSTLSVWKSKLTSMVEFQKPSTKDFTDVVNSAKAAAETAPVSHSSIGHANHLSADHPPSSNLNGGGLNPNHVSVSRVDSAATSTSVMSGKSGSVQPSQQRGPYRFSSVSSQHSHGSGRSRGSEMGPNYQQWSSSGGLDPRIPPPPMLPHTPMDLVIMVSVPHVLTENVSGSISSSAALKLRLVRSTLEFVVNHLGPKDRISLIAYTVGIEGEVRRTGLLHTKRESSWRALEEFIQSVGRPWDGDESDPFRVDLDKLGGSSERTDSVTAVNVGLDVVLQRKAKNAVTGMILINDMPDGPKRSQMDLVMARAEAANVPIHCFGYGKTHDPSSLWLISNHTRGSYTFIREWYQFRECLTGCIGSLMSIALTDVKIHVAVPQDNHFRVRKVAGVAGAIVSSTGKDVDIEIGELRYGECKELLIELELDMNTLVPHLGESHGVSKKLVGPPIEQGSATDDFMQRLGIHNLSLADSDVGDGSLEHLIDEVAVFEVDASFKDPGTGTTTSRLTNPTLLTLEVDMNSPDPLCNGPPGLAAVVAEPSVTRRRLEILVSEMITRSLLLISRKNHLQALKIIGETRRIIDAVVQAVSGSGQGKRRSMTGGPSRSNNRRQREALNTRTVNSLMAMLSDLDTLTEGLEQQNRNTFERDGRNFGAQQAMILRDQKAWTTRTDTEFLNFRDDNAAVFAAHGSAFASTR